MFLDSQAPSYRRSLLNAIVAPRPIGWVSTLNENGTANLAPFSHFNLVSTAPPVVMFSCNSPADRAEKDTLRNVRLTGEFVVNLVARELLAPMNATSVQAPYGTDEFELAGLVKASSRYVSAPRVEGGPAHLECRLLKLVVIEPEQPGDTASHMVLGRIVGVHLRDDLVDDKGRFDTVKAALMTRMGGQHYAAIGAVTELPTVHFRAGQALRPG